MSCLLPLAGAHGAAVCTVEGLEKDGQPHPVAQRLAANAGTQCGFCSPGARAALSESSSVSV